MNINLPISISNVKFKSLKRLLNSEKLYGSIDEYKLSVIEQKYVIDFCDLGLMYRERFTSTYKFTEIGKIIANYSK